MTWSAVDQTTDATVDQVEARLVIACAAVDQNRTVPISCINIWWFPCCWVCTDWSLLPPAARCALNCLLKGVKCLCPTPYISSIADFSAEPCKACSPTSTSFGLALTNLSLPPALLHFYSPRCFILWSVNGLFIRGCVLSFSSWLTHFFIIGCVVGGTPKWPHFSEQRR